LEDRLVPTTLGVPAAIAGDTAVLLDGASGYVAVPATTLNNLSSGTMEAWITLERQSLLEGLDFLLVFQLPIRVFVCKIPVFSMVAS
jgi:hypothetical protein